MALLMHTKYQSSIAEAISNTQSQLPHLLTCFEIQWIEAITNRQSWLPHLLLNIVLKWCSSIHLWINCCIWVLHMSGLIWLKIFCKPRVYKWNTTVSANLYHNLGRFALGLLALLSFKSIETIFESGLLPCLNQCTFPGKDQGFLTTGCLIYHPC